MSFGLLRRLCTVRCGSEEPRQRRRSRICEKRLRRKAPRLLRGVREQRGQPPARSAARRESARREPAGRLPAVGRGGEGRGSRFVAAGFRFGYCEKKISMLLKD